MEFPRMMYQAAASEHPSALALESGHYLCLVVADKAEYEAALKDAWHIDQYKAKDAKQDADDDAPPTRAELEVRAAQLGIKVDGRWSDSRLAEAVAKAA